VGGRAAARRPRRRMTLYLADSLRLLHVPTAEAPQEERHQLLRDHLARTAPASSPSSSTPPAAGWCSRARRAVGPRLGRRGHERRARGAARVPAAVVGSGPPPPARRLPLPPHGASVGRRPLEPGRARPRRSAPSATERAKAVAEQLLARHGVLTRQAALAENVAGGFATIYPVLRGLEEAGRIRRGYFVAGWAARSSRCPAPSSDCAACAIRSSGEDGPPALVLAVDRSREPVRRRCCPGRRRAADAPCARRARTWRSSTASSPPTSARASARSRRTCRRRAAADGAGPRAGRRRSRTGPRTTDRRALGWSLVAASRSRAACWRRSCSTRASCRPVPACGCRRSPRDRPPRRT
jgi:hypothetical protein